MSDPVIGPYPETPVLVCSPYDPRVAVVARTVARLIVQALPDIRVEHVGSTAVPHCDGKGIVDVMVVYPVGHLESVKQQLQELGFQRQTAGKLFPEERPMRVGSLTYDGTLFRIHAHVLACDSPEVASLRGFRDRLCRNPELAAAYVAHKREVLASGVTGALDYTRMKSTFIDAVLAEE